MPATPSPTVGKRAARRLHPRLRLSSEERQAEIVAAVLALARERGPDVITTQEIANRIGVTQGAIFRHFADKEAIWLAVFAWVRSALGAALDAALERAGSPLAKIERAFLAHVAFVAANPGVARVLFHELQYPGDSRVRVEVRAMIDGYRNRLARLFRDAKAARELPEALDPALAAILLIGAVQSLVIQASLAGDERGMEARARRMLPLLLDGYRGAGAR
ncbi:MAG: TetR/AcrR family transcriptional regulator [Rudaea sp.]